MMFLALHPMPISDWLPNAVIGLAFTAMGLVKVYGFSRGVVGGACKPLGTRLCGSCPSWSRPVNIGMVVLFFVIGLANLGWLVWSLISGGDAAK